MCQVRSILLSLACALFLSTAAGSPQDSCKDLANFAQESSKLPRVPDEDGVVTYVSGSAAKKMFPGQADKLSIFKKYTFVAYFNKCTSEPLYTQLRLKSGPYTQTTTTKSAYKLGLELGFDRSLSEIWEYLPKASVKAGIARGYEQVTISGVSIKEGEIKQECLVTLGWYCTALIRLDDFDSGEIIVYDRIRDPMFFPASLNDKSLYSDVWLTIPGTD